MPDRYKKVPENLLLSSGYKYAFGILQNMYHIVEVEQAYEKQVDPEYPNFSMSTLNIDKIPRKALCGSAITLRELHINRKTTLVCKTCLLLIGYGNASSE